MVMRRRILNIQVDLQTSWSIYKCHGRFTNVMVDLDGGKHICRKKKLMSFGTNGI